MARQGAAVVGARLPLSHPAELPRRRARMHAAAAAARGRWLWQGARSLVHRCDPAPQAVAAVATTARPQNGRSAGGLPARADGAVGHGPENGRGDDSKINVTPLQVYMSVR